MKPMRIIISTRTQLHILTILLKTFPFTPSTINTIASKSMINKINRFLSIKCSPRYVCPTIKIKIQITYCIPHPSNTINVCTVFPELYARKVAYPSAAIECPARSPVSLLIIPQWTTAISPLSMQLVKNYNWDYSQYFVLQKHSFQHKSPQIQVQYCQ